MKATVSAAPVSAGPPHTGIPLWRTAAALWPDLSGQAGPAILRFAGDDFMERLHETLAEGGGGLRDLVATNETWRGPAPGGRLKLYQPVHGRFYLVAAALVCPRLWYPDKRIDASKRESAFFVLRRQAAGGPELAWVPEGQGGSWRPAPVGGLAESEQRLPLFAITYQEVSGPRRLLAGLVPVSAREAYEGGRARPPAAPRPGDPMGAVTDTRLGPLMAVVGGLQALRAAASQGHGAAGQRRESLFFALIELGAWLKEQLPKVRAADSGLGTRQAALLARLMKKDGFATGRTWLDALKTADTPGTGAASDAAASGGAEPPPVAGMSGAAIEAAIAALGVELPGPTQVDPAQTTFFTEAAAAFTEAVPATAREAAAVSDLQGPGVYVLRCAYERPRCPDRLTLSPPSQPFTLAPFHDPDAPYRSTRIPTPGDVSLAGLRKHPKSVAVTVSRQLRAQLERIQNVRLADLDSGHVPDAPQVSLGMVCQLSIPIITICALILLMIIVGLLNIVFWWLPFFKICLPTVEAE
ncbi:hypothetical protein ABZ912_28335 [Nonomuraea angiospora]|uniref:hypothetical protein n=1 Tax=Nonomuraea angiospora TaxID=46172 RepID=UPI0033CD1C9A